MMLTMAQAEGQERIERRRSGNCGPVEGRGRKHDMETRHKRGSMRQQNPVSGHIRTSKDHGQCNSCQALLGNALVSEVWKRRKAHYEPPCCNTDIIDILGCRMP